ncbi:MAG: hypothetical protein PHH00_01955 [Candidatus Nanoarchaeia archaeon]|nr:hypothetical protein [Candidatus Nanoarchaeia archaeon]
MAFGKGKKAKAKEPTAEEIAAKKQAEAKAAKEKTEAEKKAEQKKAALETFNTNFVDLAAAFYVENMGTYGEAGASAVDQYIYGPAIRQNTELIFNGLLGSRQGKKRYTGNVSEYAIIQNAAKIVQESLGVLNPEDVLKLMGSKAELGEQYANKSIAELAQSENEEDKKLASALVGSYQSYVADTRVAEALSKRAEARTVGLEGILTGNDGE